MSDYLSANGELDKALCQTVALTAVEPEFPASETTVAKFVSGTSGEPAPVYDRPLRQRKTPAEPKTQKASALDAAARVLAETGVAMTCPEMVTAMAAKGYWSSPGGKTPAATLYSAILRETQTKGTAARFRKVEPGKFARTEAE